MPAIEGKYGTFFRIDPELRMFHSISDQSADRLARLSDALREYGTTLIYAPVPTRALAMPDMLPHIAVDYGYEADLAATVYDDTIRRLSRALVMNVNLRRALLATSGPFFATDPRLTPAGAEQMARAIAKVIGQEEGSGAPRAVFSSTTGAPVVWPSNMRANLQRHCMLGLAQVSAPQFVTTKRQAAVQGADNSIFGTRTLGARIALVGTDVTGSQVSNLSGFLSQATGYDVVEYSVEDGGSFAAISSYLTSDAFRESRPTYLIWTNPVSNNLAQFGDQPMRELTAAASGNCGVAVPFSGGDDARSIRVELNRMDIRPSNSLLIETSGETAADMRLDFISHQGLIRSKFVRRHPNQVKTGRFYVPLSGLWRTGVYSVDISLDVPFGANTRVSVCFE
ncbi:MAG: hypothetical protein L3J36_14420 [Rhodobacteraceae bacterium]|nr:hypothetical protein [Paracoccaceae bacterium]